MWQLYYSLECSKSDPYVLLIFSQFFYFLAITNIAAMNIHIQISCICARISVTYSQVKFVGCRLCLCSNLLGDPKLFSKVIISVYQDWWSAF